MKVIANSDTTVRNW